MTPQQISQFLQDCSIRAAAGNARLDADASYLLYVSWCGLNRKVPVPHQAFRTALRMAGLRPAKKTPHH
ncbi:hypothetical protein GCM10023346_40480 [Arthrobacter gyeryongensis]|uniref:Uncharacterized protein n=1 Tax=Arthrobacter gyeryongensis TaxID=1650592 RepID=A0ABP9SNR9_9MICC